MEPFNHFGPAFLAGLALAMTTFAHATRAVDLANASWLQADKQINNQYFGQEIPMCGEIKK